MNPFLLVPTAWLWPAAGIAGLALASAIGVQTLRVHRAQADLATVQAAWDREKAANTAAALKATTDARAEEQRRLAAQQESNREAERLIARARLADLAAAAAGDSLRQRAAALAARCRAPAGDTAAVVGGPPAATVGDLFTDVSGRLEAAGRELAAEAEHRGIAGAACQREYEALTR